MRLRDGVRLRVRSRGQGCPLLLVHGFTGDGSAWGDPILDGLARRGHRALVPDLPGHGESDAPSDPSRYRIDAVIRDLGEVLDSFGVERCPWVGYSMGGRVSLGAAVLAPARVSRLVLESASPGLGSADERARRRESDEALARRIEDEGIEAFVDRWMALPLFETQERLPPAVRDEARERRLRQRPRGLAASLRGLGTGSQPSFWSRLDTLVHRVLVLTGAEDRKYEALGDAMAERLPRARRVSVPGAGHTVHLEAPEPWLEAVESFLSADASLL